MALSFFEGDDEPSRFRSSFPARVIRRHEEFTGGRRTVCFAGRLDADVLQSKFEPGEFGSVGHVGGHEIVEGLANFTDFRDVHGDVSRKMPFEEGVKPWDVLRLWRGTFKAQFCGQILELVADSLFGGRDEIPPPKPERDHENEPKPRTNRTQHQDHGASDPCLLQPIEQRLMDRSMLHRQLRAYLITFGGSVSVFVASLAVAQPAPSTSPAPPNVATVPAPTSTEPPQVPATDAGQPPPSSTQAPVPTIALRPEAPPPIDLRPDPLPAPVPRTYHTHDGFYARVNLGFGMLDTSIDTPGSGSDLTANGDTLAMDLAIGYSPTPGIVVGGAVLFESLPSADFDDPSASEANASTLLLGPFFDGYPNARKGFHLGGTLGLAQDRLSRKSVAGFRTAEGFGLAAWIGYDFWVADEWSVGGLLRVMGTRATADADQTTNYDSGTAHVATQSIHLMITTLYH